MREDRRKGIVAKEKKRVASVTTQIKHAAAKHKKLLGKRCTTQKCFALEATKDKREQLRNERNSLKQKWENLYQKYPSLRPKKGGSSLHKEVQKVACQSGYNDCKSTIYTGKTSKRIVTVYKQNPAKLKGVADDCGCNMY